MSFSFRAVALAFSILFHGSLCVGALLLSGASDAPEERVYHVSLAEFAPAFSPDPAPPLEQAAPPAPEPEAVAEPEPVAQPEPEPQPEPVVIPDAPKPQAQAENLHPKPEKKPKPTPKQVENTAERQQTASPQGSETNSRGRAAQVIGGMSAYAEDAVDQRPSISRRAMPDYPDSARRRSIEGQVVVRLVVDSAGQPQQCAVHSSKPEGVFDKAALAAAKKTRFVPGKIKGQAVNTVVLLPYRFTLR